MTLRVGVDNLFDEQAEIVGANPGVNNNAVNTNPGFYDLLGRRAFVGFQMEF
jgi:outer membrane receptor protein involved in Fe transport